MPNESCYEICKIRVRPLASDFRMTRTISGTSSTEDPTYVVAFYSGRFTHQHCKFDDSGEFLSEWGASSHLGSGCQYRNCHGPTLPNRVVCDSYRRPSIAISWTSQRFWLVALQHYRNTKSAAGNVVNQEKCHILVSMTTSRIGATPLELFDKNDNRQCREH